MVCHALLYCSGVLVSLLQCWCASQHTGRRCTAETKTCAQDKMLSMAVANHVLWPLAKFVNAKLVPKKHQPVANKVVQVSHPNSQMFFSTVKNLVANMSLLKPGIQSLSLHIQSSEFVTAHSQIVLRHVLRHTIHCCEAAEHTHPLSAIKRF